MLVEKLAQDISMGAARKEFLDNVKKPPSKKILFEDLTDTNIVIDVDGEEYKFVGDLGISK